MRVSLCLILTALLSDLAVADVYVVDDSGGSGVDFTDLPQAVATVQDGDVLLVRDGHYIGFQTDRAISILGLSGTQQVAGLIRLHGLAGGLHFDMRHFEFDDLLLEDCAGTVILEAGAGKQVTLDSCADVRMRGMYVYGHVQQVAMRVSGSSRLELVASRITGGPGRSVDFGGQPGSGATGLLISGDSRVHVALSDVTGGQGGSSADDLHQFRGGNGGDGIDLAFPAELIVTGSKDDDIWGGQGGVSEYWPGLEGEEGRGLVNQGATRYSGAEISDITGAGYLENPATDDPVLLVTRLPGALHLEVRGTPGGNVRLMLGRAPRLPVAGFLVKPLMTEPTRIFYLGVIDASGTISMDLPGALPVALSQRFLMILQASVVAAGTTLRTNSVALQNP